MNFGASLRLMRCDGHKNIFYTGRSLFNRNRLQVAVGGLLSAFFFSAVVQAAPSPTTVSSTTVSAESAELVRNVEEGVYFYGTSAEAGVLGATYMVFQAQNSQLVGAIFMPQSSFDCFQGNVSGDQLSLQITNSYNQETYPYQIAVAASSENAVAALGTPALPLSLDGFFELGEVTDTESDILATCRSALLPEAEAEI